MCGIAGFVTLHPPPEAAAILERMTASLLHRGPDDAGYYPGPLAFLGHRRLSIIDLSGGHQPMKSEDGSHWIT